MAEETEDARPIAIGLGVFDQNIGGYQPHLGRSHRYRKDYHQNRHQRGNKMGNTSKKLHRPLHGLS